MVSELGNLNATGIIGSRVRGTKWQPSTTKGKEGMDNVIDSRAKVAISIV